MELNHALHILCALADGIDPMTGEILPEGSPYQHPDTVRALFSAIKALEQTERCPPAERSLPANAGNPWDIAEDKRLCEDFDKGIAIKILAEQHGRTPGAVKSRLERLGKITFTPPKS